MCELLLSVIIFAALGKSPRRDENSEESDNEGD